MNIEFEGFIRFKDTIKISLDKEIISFVGPNGSGKSTLLESVAIVLTFFKKYYSYGNMENISKLLNISRTTNPIWEEAIFSIEVLPETKIQELIKSTFDIKEKQTIETISFCLSFSKIDKNQFLYLKKIQIFDQEYIANVEKNFLSDVRSINELNSEIRFLQDENTKLLSFRNEYNTLKEKGLINSLKNTSKFLNEKIDTYNKNEEKISSLKSIINTSQTSKIYFSNDTSIEQKDFEEIINLLNIPDCYYIESSHDIINKNISDFYLQVEKHRSQPHSEEEDSDYYKVISKLSDFLNTKVSFGTISDKFQISIDKLPLESASLGTFLSIGFFSIINKVSNNGIILWDEPENSLHPTRRNKIYSLMKDSNRKFIIATHATEFAPIIDKNTDIYKLISKFDIKKNNHPICTVTPIKTILESFDILKILGLEPSKVLFTANCIIWLEGPSDVIYFRFWIKNYIEQNNLDLIEGFDYTFILSSGSLLAHYTYDDFDTGENYNQNEKITSIMNVFNISPSSIFISDSDINTKNLEEDNIKFDEKEQELFNENRLNNKFSDIDKKILKKPRILNIITAIEKLNNKDSFLLITYGRETENYIKEYEFIEVVKSFYKIDSKDTELIEIINKIKFDKFDNFIESIENEFSLLEVKEPYKDKLVFTNKTQKKEISRKKDLKSKRSFAMNYVEYFKDKDFNFSTLRDGGKDIEIIVRKIKEIKDNYYF